MTTRLCRDLGLGADEGLMAAFIPTMDAVPLEHDFRYGERRLKGYSYDGMLLDVLPTDDTRPVKWWVVRQCAREQQLDYPEPFWTGPAGDFRVKSLHIPPKPPNTRFAVRGYSRGPWVTLTDEELASYAE